MSIFNTDNILDKSPLSGAIKKSNKDNKKQNTGLIQTMTKGLEDSVWKDFDFSNFSGGLMSSVEEGEKKRQRLSNAFLSEEDMVDAPDEEEMIIRDAFDQTMRLQNKVNKVKQEYNQPYTQEPQSQSPTNQSTVAGNSNTNSFTTDNQYSTQMNMGGGTAGYFNGVVDKIQDRRQTEQEKRNSLKRKLSSYDAYYDTTDEIGSSLEYLSKFFT